MRPNQRSVQVNTITIENGNFSVLAGPCSIESRDQFLQTSQFVLQNGASMVRGGIYKMRTRPDTFQGLGLEALPFIHEMKQTTGAPFVSEITDTRQVDGLYAHVDCFQVGSRNMYNYELLKELGRQDKPVLLKRGFSATVDEWLKAADYLVLGGNENVILCERGIRSFDSKMRNLLDLASVAYLKAHFDFPIVVDPSHGTGRPEIIPAMACAAIAAGADGLMVEVHPAPSKALSDGFQALSFKDFENFMNQIRPFVTLAGKKLSPSSLILGKGNATKTHRPYNPSHEMAPPHG